MTKKNLAVMAHRGTPLDALDFFPTPPWATRALFEHVIGPNLGCYPMGATVWEPACGAGHMSAVLAEYFKVVYATDIQRYVPFLGDVFTGEFDFLSEPPEGFEKVDWVITNPPFKSACDFVLKAMDYARFGIAMLARTTWIESKDRYERLFRDTPPTIYAPFVERVAMVKGHWDPKIATATSYAWFVWLKTSRLIPEVHLIPPGCSRPLAKGGLLHPTDHQRFARRLPAPLLEVPHESTPRLRKH